MTGVTAKVWKIIIKRMPMCIIKVKYDNKMEAEYMTLLERDKVNNAKLNF